MALLGAAVLALLAIRTAWWVRPRADRGAAGKATEKVDIAA